MKGVWLINNFILPFRFEVFEGCDIKYMLDGKSANAFVEEAFNYLEFDNTITIYDVNGCKIEDELYDNLMNEYREYITTELYKLYTTTITHFGKFVKLDSDHHWSVCCGKIRTGHTFISVKKDELSLSAMISFDGIYHAPSIISPSPREWKQVSYNYTKGIFAIFSLDGIVATSTDGITWQEHDMPFKGDFKWVSGEGGVFTLKSKSSGESYTSVDGNTWIRKIE